MKIEKQENFTKIISEEKTFSAFYTAFLATEKAVLKEHLIFQLSEDITVSEEELLLVYKKVSDRKKNGMSFALVYKNINIDNFPDDFNIVPTIIEAEYILEMEAIERELGL